MRLSILIAFLGVVLVLATGAAQTDSISIIVREWAAVPPRVKLVMAFLAVLNGLWIAVALFRRRAIRVSVAVPFYDRHSRLLAVIPLTTLDLEGLRFSPSFVAEERRPAPADSEARARMQEPYIGSPDNGALSYERAPDLVSQGG